MGLIRNVKENKKNLRRFEHFFPKLMPKRKVNKSKENSLEGSPKRKKIEGLNTKKKVSIPISEYFLLIKFDVFKGGFKISKRLIISQKIIRKIEFTIKGE